MMRVAVIGAGASGLTSIKACKESDLDVVCYEWSGSVGGVWNYKENPVEGMGSVDKTTVTNTSKEFLAYSDFPFPEYCANFLRHTYVLKYLEAYAEKFRLYDCVKFNHRVKSVVPTEDYEVSGKWKVVVASEKEQRETEDVVDAVMICAGHHGYPLKVSFEGNERFRGNIIHNHAYRNPQRYEGKRTLIIGLGNTAGDTAVDVCSFADKTYLSTRSGSWILKRMDKSGVPYDLPFLNRMNNAFMSLLPFSWKCSTIESSLNEWFDHEKYQLSPKHRLLEQQLTVNDSIPFKILCGEIVMKGNIRCFEEKGVIFEGEREVTEVDEVILATGYETKFPFLSDDILDIRDNQVQLYKYVYPPNMKHATFGMIGLLDGLGGTFPYMELQARWFVEVLKKRVFLPSEGKMRKFIAENTQSLRKRFYKSPRHCIIADYIPYLDDISSLIGVKPNLWKILITDPKLWLALLRGPSSPYQYRLGGAHSWPLARETILNYNKRIWGPLQTRFKKGEDKELNVLKILAIGIVFVAVLFVVLLR